MSIKMYFLLHINTARRVFNIQQCFNLKKKMSLLKIVNWVLIAINPDEQVG